MRTFSAVIVVLILPMIALSACSSQGSSTQDSSSQGSSGGGAPSTATCADFESEIADYVGSAEAVDFSSIGLPAAVPAADCAFRTDQPDAVGEAYQVDAFYLTPGPDLVSQIGDTLVSQGWTDHSADNNSQWRFESEDGSFQVSESLGEGGTVNIGPIGGNEHPIVITYAYQKVEIDAPPEG